MYIQQSNPIAEVYTPANSTPHYDTTRYALLPCLSPESCSASALLLSIFFLIRLLNFDFLDGILLMVITHFLERNQNLEAFLAPHPHTPRYSKYYPGFRMLQFNIHVQRSTTYSSVI
jgi:hypothetical protein